MKYINHFTLSTGHSRRSYAEEIDKAFLMKFKPIVNNIIKTGEICEFAIKGTYMDIIMDGTDHYAATLYVDKNGQKVPIIVMEGTSNSEKRKMVEEDIKVFRRSAFGDGKVSFILPEAPLIVDVILPEAAMRLDLLIMTGDLSRCLAWTILDPGSVLK